MPTWSTGLSLRGSAGAQLLYGHGAPAANVGNPNDGYIDVDAGRLYAQKSATTGWPTTYASLVGPQGGSVRVGSGPPTVSPANPEIQGDADVYVQLDATNGPALWGPRANAAWPSSSTSLAGAAGASVLSGYGPPSNSIGTAATPAYIDLTNSVVYGPKVNGSWPTSGVSIVGQRGSNFSFGTAEPGLTYMLVNDVYFRTTTQNLYVKITNAAPATTADYPNGWQIIGNLKGATGAASTVAGPQGTPGTAGAAGLSVVSNNAAPTSTDGVVGSPAFVNTAAATLYGAKTSSGWPSSFVSLIGPVGPAGPVIYSGSGSPSSTNPGGTITAGSFFIETDTTPNRLFGPYSTANGWPATYTAMGGGSFQTTSGPPASSLGSVGDCAFDLTNALFYPPKTSSGWVTTPINMVGPTGPPGITSAYRQTTTGFIWQAVTAGTVYNFSRPLTNASGYGSIPLREIMPAAGTLFAIGLTVPGSVGASTISPVVLKNGTAIWTATNAITTTSATTPQDALVKAASTYSFSAGDVLTMTATWGTTTNTACLYATLYYTLNG